MLFVASTFAMMLDPINMAGWILAGVLLRDVRAALAAAAGWSLAVEVLVIALNPGYGGHLLFSRILAGGLVAATGWVLVRQVWKRNTA